MTRTRTIIIIGAAAVTTAVAGGLVFASRQSRREVLADGGTIRVPRQSAPVREVLWQPATPLRASGSAGGSGEEYEPRLSADGTVMILVRGRPSADGSGQADLYTSRWTPAGWTEPAAIASINTPADELGPELSADGTRLYFYSNRPGGYGGHDLWVSTALGDGWSTPVNLGPSVNTAWNEYGPALAPDGGRLYFASNRPRAGEAAVSPEGWSATVREKRTRHDYDLYVAEREGEELAQAVPLTGLNTAEDEGAPAVSPAGDFIYFASDRAGGIGGFDVYRARISGGTSGPVTLGAVENLGGAINTAANELDPALAAHGFKLCFSSDRGADGSAVQDAAEKGRYSLWSSTTREVYRDVEFVAGGGVNPTLLKALLLLLAVAPLLLLLKLLAGPAWRRRFGKLSLLAQCVILSAAIHAAIASMLTVWKVGSGVIDLMNGSGASSMGTRVILSSASSAGSGAGSIQSQVQGGLVDAAPLALAMPVAELAKVEGAEVKGATEIALQSAAPVADQKFDGEPRRAEIATDMRVVAALPRGEAAETASPSPVAPTGPASEADQSSAGRVSTVAAPAGGAEAVRVGEGPKLAGAASSGEVQDLAGPQVRGDESTRGVNAVELPKGTTPGSSAVPSVAAAAPSVEAAATLPSVGGAGSAPAGAEPGTAGWASKRADAPLPSGGGVALPMVNGAPIRTNDGAGERSTGGPVNVAAGPVVDSSSVGVPALAPIKAPAADSEQSPSAAALTAGRGGSAAASAPLPPPPPPLPSPAGAGPGGGPAAPALASPAAGAADAPPVAPLAVLPGGGAGEATGAGAMPVPLALSGGSAARADELPVPKETFDQRSPAARSSLVEAGGGSAETERAVGRALEWFASVQSADGRWSARGFLPGRADASPAEIDADAGMTGLTLLCYLGAGHTHREEGPYRERVEKGLKWLVSRMNAEGDLRGSEAMYSQTVAAVALCEAYAMTRDPELAGPAQRAVEFVLRRAGAGASGGGDKRDASVIGWLVFTVESARRAGFKVPETVFASATRWLDQVAVAGSPGRYGYTKGGAASRTMTAEAMFVRQIVGKAGRDDPRMKQSAEYVVGALPAWNSEAPTHHWYYATLALFQQQGEAWATWNTAMTKALVENQRRDGPLAGSWDPSDGPSKLGGRVYQTAICTLSLEVYYRYRAEKK